MFINYLALLRPQEHIKNLFIFLPLFFGLKFFDLKLLCLTFLVFIAFSIVASAVYVLNDCFDIESDKVHTFKKNRALPSGLISKNQARNLAILLLIFGGTFSFFLSVRVFYIIMAYFLLNLFYSFKAKHIPILDVSMIAFGFVLRLFAGSAISDISLSMWILIITFLLALFLALSKRREDVLIFLDSGIKTRSVVDGYNLEFLNISMMIMASVVIVSYILYTVSPDVIAKTHSNFLYLTTVFVIFGILRYLQIIFVEKKRGSPTDILLKDRIIQLCVFLWLLSFMLILY